MFKLIQNTSYWFAIPLSMLLLSFPWSINVSSWATVVFSIVVALTPPDRLKLFFENKGYLLISCYYLYMVVHSLLAFQPGSSYSFITTCSPLILFPLIFAARTSKEIIIIKETILTIFSLGVTIGLAACLLYALYKFRNEFYLFQNGYAPVTSLIGMHPSYLSLYVSFSFVIIIDNVITHHDSLSLRKKTINYLWLSFLAFGVFYIRSRTGMVTFVILVLFIILYRIPKRHRILFTAGFITLLGLLYLSVHVTSFHKGRAQLDQVAHSIELKQKQWEGSIHVIKENFLLGVSKIQAQKELNMQYEQMEFQEGIDNKYNSHNQFLTTFLEEGLVGFLLLFTPFLLIFYQGIKRNDLIMVCFFILTSLTFLTESMLDRHKGIIYYSLFLALLGFRIVPESFEKQPQSK